MPFPFRTSWFRSFFEKNRVFLPPPKGAFPKGRAIFSSVISAAETPQSRLETFSTKPNTRECGQAEVFGVSVDLQLSL